MTYIEDIKRVSSDCTVDYLLARIEALQKQNEFLTMQLDVLTLNN